MLGRGLTLLLSIVEFAFGRFAFGVRFALADLFALLLPLELPLAFSLSFLFLGFFGLFSLLFTALFVLRLSSSAGFTVSEASPCLVARLMSIATVWPALTTSPGRGN